MYVMKMLGIDTSYSNRNKGKWGYHCHHVCS